MLLIYYKDHLSRYSDSYYIDMMVVGSLYGNSCTGEAACEDCIMTKMTMVLQMFPNVFSWNKILKI